MIASWMLYAFAIGVLVTVAAFAAEHALTARGQPTRFVWAAALILSIAWPVGAAVARLLPAPPQPVSVLPFTIVVQAPSIDTGEPAALDRAALIDRGLAALWLGLSALRHARAAWKRGRVNGMPVQLSDNVGPAVVGLRPMDVVLPKWILSLDEPLREIVLRHEEEHRSARDPYLLLGGVIAVALMPWNVALWIQARRLRLAIEMDCDARVLRAHPSPERYGMLMLTIAQRRSVSPALFAPMLSEPTTNLERRILAMRTTTRKVARMTVYGGGTLAIAVLAFASSLSAGTSWSKRTAPTLIAPVAGVPTPTVVPETIPVKKPAAVSKQPGDTQTVRKLEPSVVFEKATRQVNPTPRYPDALRAAGIEGVVVATFATDARGLVDPASIVIVQSPHELLSEAVRNVLPLWHAAPGVTIRTPFVFVLANKSAQDIESLARTMPPGAVVIEGLPGYGKAAVGPTPVNADQTFFEFQVENPAKPMPGNQTPRYPAMLRSANVEGVVLAQFVLDADGVPDLSTFKVLKSNHELFTAAVKEALPEMRFYPATVGGRNVRQLVQMPFLFSLSKPNP